MPGRAGHAAVPGVDPLKKDKASNVPASVRQRLLNLANRTKQDFGLILTKYALERLLYRLSLSKHRDTFVLKGALLFELWTSQPYRPTRDLDLLGQGDSSIEKHRRIFSELCYQEVEDDGLILLAKTIRVERIRDEEEYEGIRVLLEARLGNAKIPLQIDVGFGDIVTPAPVEVAYPTLLNFPAPRLRAYPRESVVAEKFEAMVKLGIANSRMKYFYDLYALSREFEFDGLTLSASIAATFKRRRTPLPSSAPLALTPEFYEASTKQIQWAAFLRKSGLKSADSLSQVATHLKSFFLPAVEAIRRGEVFGSVWRPGGPWSVRTNG
jgi:predicted nucleotidyltransferase component of viral defense system